LSKFVTNLTNPHLRKCHFLPNLHSCECHTKANKLYSQTSLQRPATISKFNCYLHLFVTCIHNSSVRLPVFLVQSNFIWLFIVLKHLTSKKCEVVRTSFNHFIKKKI
jgi:hypothetical protein